jgi:hypothetical protein
MSSPFQSPEFSVGDDVCRSVHPIQLLILLQLESVFTLTYIILYWKANINCNITLLSVPLLCMIYTVHILGTEPGSSGSIVSDYGLDDRAIEVRSPAEAKDFSCSLYVQTGSEAHPASCTMGTGGPFPGGKARPGRDADHSPQFRNRYFDVS